MNNLLIELRCYYAKYSILELQDMLYDKFIGNETELDCVFNKYCWTFDIIDKDNINPSFISVLFEDYIDQKTHASFYTPQSFTNFISHDVLEQRNIATKILDPSCGAGNFILEALYYQFNKFKHEYNGNEQTLKLYLIENCLYGVDIMPEAVYTTILRLKLALYEHGALPSDIKHNIKVGNALIGLQEYKPVGLFSESNPDVILLYHMNESKIKYEGFSNQKSILRELTIEDVRELNPFHWGIEFNTKFDVILMNPPWMRLSKDSKEFFMQYDDTLTKNSKPKVIEEIKNKLLQDLEISRAYDKYLSSFNHLTKWLRAHPIYSQYKNQDNNLYKYFMLLSLHILNENGECAAVIPSGIYTDMSTQSFRTNVFDNNTLIKLIGFTNKKKVFNNVDSTFKFCIFHYKKGGVTNSFKTSFGNDDINNLNEFKDMDVDFVKRSSPTIHSIIEIKNDIEFNIINKLIKFPKLSEIEEEL